MVLKQLQKDSVYEGDCCYTGGDLENAVCWYGKFLKKNPKNVEVLTKKANILVIQKRYSKAYRIYNMAFFYAGVFEIIENYVKQFHMDLDRDIHTLLALLNTRNNIPITLGGLRCVLKKTQTELEHIKETNEWRNFKKSLQRKNLYSIDNYVDLYLKKFGERFYMHFWSLYCYLREEKGYTMTPNHFASILMEHKKKMKLEQFERFLRTGRKQPLLDKMTGTEFANFLADFFENKGYIVRKNPHSYDYGADLIVEKLGETIAVQAKCRKQPVGIKAVQEVQSGRGYYLTQKALVVSTSCFTKPAVEMAKRIGVELWDRKRLLDELRNPYF